MNKSDTPLQVLRDAFNSTFSLLGKWELEMKMRRPKGNGCF